jgi:MFS family permease
MTTYKAIFRNRSLLLVGLSESVSNIGNWITMMAVFTLIIFSGKGSVIQSSAVYLAGLLPTLFFSPVAGWLCDRLDRKWLMIASELISGLIISGIIYIQRIEFIYILLALQSISTSIMTPARQSVLPDLVRREDLTGANAFLQQLSSIIKIGAPMLAGALLAVLNPHQAVILDVISFILSAAVLVQLPNLPPHRVGKTGLDLRKPGFGEAEGVSSTNIREVFQGSPRLCLVFLVPFIALILFMGFDVLAPIYIRDVLKGGESLFGILVGLIGLGSLGSAMILMFHSGNQNLWRDVLGGLILLWFIPSTMALGAYLAGTPGAAPLVAIGCLVGGIGSGLLNIQITTLLQLLSPPEILGRMGGLFQSTSVAGQFIGMIITPLLVPALLSLGSYFGAAALAVPGLIFLTGVVLWLTRSAPQRLIAHGD